MIRRPVFVRGWHDLSRPSSARGPWDPRALHGGAPAALLVRAFEQLLAADRAAPRSDHVRVHAPGAARTARRSRAEVSRPGRRVQLLEGSICAGRDRGRPRPGAAGPARPSRRRRHARQPPPSAGPEHGGPRELRLPHRPMFAQRRGRDPVRRGRLPPTGPVARPGFACVSPIVAGETAERRSSAWRRPAISATGSRNAVVGRATCSSTPT